MTNRLQQRQRGVAGWLPPGGAWTSLWCAAALVMAAMPASSQPANDDFAAAQVLVGNTGTFSVDTGGATLEANEPPHSGTGGASVWFVWTATNSGAITFHT